MGRIPCQSIDFQSTQGSTAFENEYSTQKISLPKNIISQNMHSRRCLGLAAYQEIDACTAAPTSP